MTDQFEESKRQLDHFNKIIQQHAAQEASKIPWLVTKQFLGRTLLWFLIGYAIGTFAIFVHALFKTLVLTVV